MSKGIRFTDEFKRDAVAQVVDRGYAVSEVAKRPGISTKSRYAWKSQFSKPAKVLSDEAALAAELRQVRKEFARVTEERDILKKATAYFARESRLSTRLSRLIAPRFKCTLCVAC